MVCGIFEVRPQIKVLYGLEFNLSVISDDIAVHAPIRKFAGCVHPPVPCRRIPDASADLGIPPPTTGEARCTPARTIDLFPNRARGQFPAYNNDVEPYVDVLEQRKKHP